MIRTRRYLVTLYGVLGLLLVMVAVKSLPGALSAHTTGFSGHYQQGVFVVDHLDQGGPAAEAGLAIGDKLTMIDNLDVAKWYQLYHDQSLSYIKNRRTWQNRRIAVTFDRAGEPGVASLHVRPLSAGEAAQHFTVHLVLVLLLAALCVFILISIPRDRRAFLVTTCFLGVIVWVAADIPTWPGFMGSLVPVYGPREFLYRDLAFTFSIQLVLGILIHLFLVFPSQWLPSRTMRWLLPGGYLLSVGSVAIYLLFIQARPIGDHLHELHNFRLSLDTVLLVVLPTLIGINYRYNQTAVQREQARWVIRALVIVIALHLLLWNLPKLLFGVPLVHNYNWLWLSTALVPLALTIAITNHHIFGTQGLVRRRLSVLDMMLDRQRSMVERRDDEIARLEEEIRTLREELGEYEASERAAHHAILASDALQRLQDNYPEIRRARESVLLGNSPIWEKVFSDAVLAARGLTPVVISGESGTGKTDLAQLIHRLGDRRDQVYREVSCAQFEHADPAFALGRLFGIGTGHGLSNAPRDGQPGLLEECDGGVLFLDDFDRLPLNVQDLLLYPLEGKAFDPGIGRGAPRTVSVKFILATNRDLQLLVRQGNLQNDVLARMGAHVHIPPLRERREDIPLLANHFLKLLVPEMEHRIDNISSRAMKLICRYPYSQGNARELKSELRLAVGKASLERDSVLRAGYLSERINGFSLQEPAAPEPASTSEPAAPIPEGIPVELAVLRRNDFQIAASETELGLSHKSKTLSHHLRGLCLRALAENDWHTQAAARALAPDQGTGVWLKLERKMERYLRSIAERLADGTERRLFNNLPAAYHEVLRQAIVRARGS